MPRRLIIDLTLHSQPAGLRGVTERLFLSRYGGESTRHLMMKLLSYLLLYREGLEIERSAGQHYKPDLLQNGPEGRPRLWVDCGATAPKKLVEVVRKNRAAHVVIVKATPSELRHYHRLTVKRIKDVERVSYIAPKADFLAHIGAAFESGGRAVEAHISSQIKLLIEGREFVTGLSTFGRPLYEGHAWSETSSSIW